MPTTAHHRTIEVVEHADATFVGNDEVHEVMTDRVGTTDVVWSHNEWGTGVKIDRWAGGLVAITREGKGGYLLVDAGAARTRMVPVFRCGDGGPKEPVAAFGDSPRAYPEVTDLGWFARTDQFTAWRMSAGTFAEVAVELAIAHLS